mmetsp:Transcript_12058/g.26786  ORF Transcript_12058/g.26786 Transcript_12058/m.26786 type:complete len:404 (-) Transcript_12058:8-1219(-)
MHLGNLELTAEVIVALVLVNELINLQDVRRGDHCLLLSWVGDLRDRWHWPLTDVLVRAVHGLHAAIVAIANCEDPWIALRVYGPGLLVPCHHGQIHVHKDPASASGPLLAQSLCRHEVVRGLDTNADILLELLLITTLEGELNLLPEVWILRVELCAVELLDLLLLHILLAVGCGTCRQWPQRLRKGINDGHTQIWEEVVQFCGPLHSDEASTHNQNRRLLVVELLEACILFQNVPAPTLQETLIQVRPAALRPGLSVHCWEPKRLTPLVKGSKVATACDNTVVKIERLLRISEHWLDCRRLLWSVQLRHLTPDELAPHSPFNHWKQGERQSIEMLRLHVCTQHARSVLEVLLAVNNGDQVVILQVTGNAEPSKAAANNEHAAVRTGWHGSFLPRSGRRGCWC